MLKIENRISFFVIALLIVMLSACSKQEGATVTIVEEKEVTHEDTSEIEKITEMPEEVIIEDTTTEKKYPSISEVYQDVFKIGVAIPAGDIDNPQRSQIILDQFNSLTCENEMKPDFLLDRQKTLDLGDPLNPVINYKNAEPVLKFAKENNLQMRGHTLVWHSQTPRWLFAVDYDNAQEAPLVDRATMIARMDSYIKQVMEYVNTNYSGIIYAWDVVNEAVNPGDGLESGIRTTDNLWYEVIGEDYVEYAFTFARKYAAEDQKLFYNDYGTYDKMKMFKIIEMVKPLKEKSLIDGIGMQSHIQLGEPAILDYQYAINKYAQLGLDIQITELDIGTLSNDEETQSKLATRYKNVMLLFRNMTEKEKAHITSVTFWGLSDDRSWLNKSDAPNYPLLFDNQLKPKPAFFGAINDTIDNYKTTE